MKTIVRSQAELDAALASPDTYEIVIDSPEGVGLHLSGTDGKYVTTTGNSVIEWATGNSVIEWADGNSVIKWADGNSVIKWATGNSVIERATNSVIERATGNSVIERADGNSVIERADGNSVIERADGNSVIKWATGNSVIEWATGNSVIKRATGNSVIKRATGNSVIEWADGNSVIEWADGNSVIKWATGNSVIERATNSVIERATGNSVIERADGNSVIERADGNSVIERADGNSVIKWADGNSVIKWATGNSVIKRATGNSVIKRATGNSVIKRADGNSVIGYLLSKIAQAAQASTVHAYGSAVVESAGSSVAVFLHSGRATVSGGVLIDLTTLSLDTAEGWCEWNDVEIVDGNAILYKAVDERLRSGYGLEYPIGQTVTAADWRDRDECGYGLHFCPSPRQARDYHPEAKRFLKVAVAVAGLRPITGDSTPKCKAQSGTVLVEVDIDGVELKTEAVAS